MHEQEGLSFKNLDEYYPMQPRVVCRITRTPSSCSMRQGRKKIQPHQIDAAGDLTDPHGAHWICLEAIRQR